MGGDWDGRERRGMNQNEMERDRLLTEVHSDVKHLVKSFDYHLVEDNSNFKSLRDGQKFLERIVYGALGMAALVTFLAQFVKP